MKDIIFKKENRVALILGVLLVVTLVVVVVLMLKMKAPVDDQVKDLQKTIAKVSRLIVLPADEQPTLATVSDIEKLKDQPFFTNAKNGDKVLIYPRSLKAILYSPSQDKIIEVSSVNVPPQTQ